MFPFLSLMHTTKKLFFIGGFLLAVQLIAIKWTNFEGYVNWNKLHNFVAVIILLLSGSIIILIFFFSTFWIFVRNSSTFLPCALKSWFNLTSSTCESLSTLTNRQKAQAQVYSLSLSLSLSLSSYVLCFSSRDCSRFASYSDLEALMFIL